MSKRSRKREGGLFDGLQDTPSLEDSTDAIFGATPFPVAPPIKVKSIDINLIYPDPSQPRRAIPSELRERWTIHDDTFEDLISLWFSYMHADFNLGAYLFDGETERSQVDNNSDPLMPDFEPENAVQMSLFRLLELASSILREGLTNPITVSRMGRDYLIETGERRWLAYQLLNLFFEDDEEQDWSKIPARVMQDRSVWRQATENNARQNLNAVSRARQLAILLMDIHGWDNFHPMSDFETEQEFYAQVSDGREWRIPRDKTEQLLKAMSLNNQTQLRQYRSILRIPNLIWKEADDNDWTENYIREAIKQLSNPQSVSDPKSVTTVTETGKSLPIDRAIHKMHKYRESISKKANRAKKDSRLQWQEFAREQAEWWDNLAQHLDDDN